MKLPDSWPFPTDQRECAAKADGDCALLANNPRKLKRRAIRAGTRPLSPLNDIPDAPY